MVSSKGVEPVQRAATAAGSLPLAALNHISVVCRCLESSLRFYRDVLGFVPIRRPGSFDFDGAWYGIRLHTAIPLNTDAFIVKLANNHIYTNHSTAQAVQLRHRHSSPASRGSGEHAPQEDGDQPQGQPRLLSGMQ